MTIAPDDLIPVRTSQAHVGERFGRLVVRSVGRSADRRYFAVCDCDCGSAGRLVQIARLRSGRTKGCGCGSGQHLVTHGLSGHPAFGRWQGMISRCYHPSHPSYANYGGRGIDVCERWMEPEGFLADMGDSFEPDLDLDRIDGSRGYAPDNCRWVSRAENLDNRSVTHMVEYAGETLPLRLWAERIGISLKLLSKRLYERGWSVERAFATPVLSRTEAARVANVASRKARGRA